MNATPSPTSSTGELVTRLIATILGIFFSLGLMSLLAPKSSDSFIARDGSSEFKDGGEYSAPETPALEDEQIFEDDEDSDQFGMFSDRSDQVLEEDPDEEDGDVVEIIPPTGVST